MKIVIACAIVAVLVLGGFLVLTNNVAAQPPAGGFVDTMSWSLQPSGTQAILNMALPVSDPAHLDVWLYSLSTPADVAAAKTNPAVGTISVAGSVDDLFINPIPVDHSVAGASGVNPFSNAVVREALNYLVDRDFMTREITPGKGPMYTMWFRQAPDYGREAVFMQGIERKYAFNPNLGRQMISTALLADPDYSFVSGHWMWKGAPVVLKIIIRIEDERRNVGDYVAGILEGLGFTVDRQYKDVNSAFDITYYGPADIGAWHIYTEGLATLATVAWDDAAPWNSYIGDAFGSNIWSVSGYKPAAALLKAGNDLFYANYTSLAQRQSLVETAVTESVKDSVRLWLVNNAVFAYSRHITSFAYDLSGGTWSPFSPRTMRFATTGGDLKVGQRRINREGWQPWRIDNLYDALAMAPGPLTDVGVYTSPHTGLYIPVRSEFSVTTLGATGSIAVPAAAQVWDSTTGGFKAAGAGTTAKSKVTYTYTFGKWHDGTDFTMTDVLYETALVFRRAQGDIHAVDSDAAAGGAKLFASVFKGLLVASPTTMDVYLDYWHPDNSTIAATGSVFPSTPWTASELGLSTLLTGGAPCVLSATTALVTGKLQLDMTKGGCLTAMQANYAGYAAAKHRPPGFSSTILPDATVGAAWAALQAFQTTYGHYFVANGPYFLSNVNAPVKQYQMTRDPNYPFSADHWDRFLVPKIPTVVIAPAPGVLIGRPATFDLGVTVSSTPYDDFTMTWLVINTATGAVLYQGTPTKVASGTYQIALTATQTKALAPGAYALQTITVGAQAAPPVFTTTGFIALPDVDTIVAEQNAKINTLERELDQKAAANANATTALTAQLATANTVAYVALGIGVVGVLAGIMSIVLGRRRKPAAPPEQP